MGTHYVPMQAHRGNMKHYTSNQLVEAGKEAYRRAQSSEMSFDKAVDQSLSPWHKHWLHVGWLKAELIDTWDSGIYDNDPLPWLKGSPGVAAVNRDMRTRKTINR